MSKAPRKPDPAAEKPAPKRRQNPKGSRKIKDPVKRSEAYVENTAMTHGQAISEAKKRIGRLRELIEPETEAMVRVMIDIAKNADHLRDPKTYPPIHASIRLEAADRVLSRAYGKPKEHVEVSDAADGAAATDEVMTLLGNIFEAVGLPPLLENKGSLASGPSEGSPTS